ncbi:SigE family RNA polymerase sigma factor [Phytohabitans flavus]|uniref:SigE family RNA polymerase sigma factor n=1 Tax=Phytohabitans flavus TaxID=1076124 RepID=UPI0018D9E6BC|nr:SigE family RNA polymerase sigma factor [Phytohabitans flavus]
MSAPGATAPPGARPRAEVVELSGSRDEQFEAFVADVGPYLLRVALLLSGDRSQAEDLVQTTFERTYRSWERARRTDPRAYARKVLVNLRIDRWRGLRLEVLTSPDTLPEGTTPSHADTVDGRNEVVRLLAELPLAQRRVVVLRHLLGLTESETAKELAVSIGTVKSHNARALARLRTLLTKGQQ